MGQGGKMQKSTIYTVSEAAERLKVSKPTLYKLFNSGKLEFFWVGGLRRVTEEQIENYIRENGNQNGNQD